jgi:hypothetical protein
VTHTSSRAASKRFQRGKNDQVKVQAATPPPVSKPRQKRHNQDVQQTKNQILEEKHTNDHHLPNSSEETFPEENQSSWVSRLITLWLAGVLAALPVKILNLPLNFELVEVWSLLGMPVVLWLYSLRRPRSISLSYAVPMWFVLVSSFISAFTSPVPSRSLIVLFKEIYLFVWFFVMLVLLFQMNARDLRQVLRIWSIVVLGHGALMVAQFLSPQVWEFTNSLGGNSANLEGYRAAGLFICDKAGCANKAAVFQLLGFVPLLLAGYSKRTTVILGVYLFISMMTTGSMGATIAFSSGLIVAIFAIAYFKKSLGLVIKIFVRVALALLVLGGIFYAASRQSPDKLNHFEKIIVGRYEKSSGGRFDLWSRGIDVLLEHNAFLWGVGPENFREVDPSGHDNQLHNDTLAFLVERGLLGLIGLALFPIITLKKAIQILQIFSKDPKRAGFGVVVFVAALVAALVESLTHQIFHTRELWLVLAVQEAVLYKMLTSEYGIEPIVQRRPEPSQFRAELLRSPDVIANG